MRGDIEIMMRESKSIIQQCVNEGMSASKIGGMFDVSKSTVLAFMRKNSIKRKEPIVRDENLVQSLWGIALNRTAKPFFVETVVKKFEPHKSSKGVRNYIKEEDDMIIALAKTHSMQELADKLGRTHGSVESRIRYLRANLGIPIVCKYPSLKKQK